MALVRQDYDLALNYYQQAYNLDGDRKDPRGQAVHWERLGRLFLGLQDYPRAEAHLREALRSFRQLEDTDGIADTLLDLTRLPRPGAISRRQPSTAISSWRSTGPGARSRRPGNWRNYCGAAERARGAGPVEA